MLEYTKDNFIDFIKNSYDLDDDKVKHKLNHTFHVVDNTKYLCDKLNIDNTNKMHFNHTKTFKIKCKRNSKKMTKLQQLS